MVSAKRKRAVGWKTTFRPAEIVEGSDDHDSQVIVEVGLDDNGSEKVDELSVDDKWINSVKGRCLATTNRPSSHKDCLIYKVNPLLRKGNESAYDPIIISIGPYHRGKEHLKPMEAYKGRYVCDLLSRNLQVRFEHLMKEVKGKEEQVRQCYPEHIDLESNEFVEMILLDGCFIVELFLKLKSLDGGRWNGPSWWCEFSVGRDLLLLENQIPFFILQHIYDFVMPKNTLDPCALVELFVPIFDCMLGVTNEKPNLLDPSLVYHLLHLFHSRVLPNQTSIVIEKSMDLKLKRLLPTCLGRLSHGRVGTPSPQQLVTWMPNATALQEAGVKFKVGKGNLVDTRFFDDKGVMEIPHIAVDAFTEMQLRNLIAFEQCCLGEKSHYFSNYITFMDCLVNTSMDVEILHSNGILMHTLGSDKDVALLFNNLRKGVVTDYQDNYLRDTFKRVTEYSNSRMHKWRASLARDYFYSPWAILSFLAAIIILSLTAAQTVFSGLSYKPS